MKRIVLSAVLSAFIIGCGSPDQQARLRKLEAERDALSAEIEQLKQEITGEKGEHEREKATPVDISRINPAPFRHFIKVQGTIKSDNNILVPPKSSGIVKRIHVTEGDRVAKGQLLAELDGAIYESTIAELETNLALATTVFERQERLWKKKIGSEIQYLQARTNKEGLEKRLATVNEQYRLTKITAPISGTVDEVLIKEGEGAGAGFGAVRIVQLSKLKIEAALSESYISQVKRGDTVQVHIPVLGMSFSQTIGAASQVIHPKNRTFNIEIQVPNSLPSLKPNMLAVLTINDYSNRAALTVPINVVQRTGSEKFLFVAREHPRFSHGKYIVERRLVETGAYYEDRVEIVSGIAAGESIVVMGFQDLADGQTVAVGEDRAAARPN